MKWVAPGWTQAVALVLLAAAGCRSPQRAVAPSPVRCAVTFEGCGCRGASVALAADRRTLRDAFARVSVDPVLNAGGYPALVFARLQRPGGEYYVATDLIPDTPAGDILLDAGETIDLVPWTSTDLMRGLKQVTPPAVVPAPAYLGRVQPLFDWYARLPTTRGVSDSRRAEFEAAKGEVERAVVLDNIIGHLGDTDAPTKPSEIAPWWVAFVKVATRRAREQRSLLVFQPDLPDLLTQYPARPRSGGAFDIDAVGLDQLGRPYRDPTFTRTDPARGQFPRVGNFFSIGPEGAIAVLERTTNDQPMTFMLPKPMPIENKTPEPSQPVKSDIRENALVFDGDVITITPPENVPIVQASLTVSQHVIQPMMQRRKACVATRSRP